MFSGMKQLSKWVVALSVANVCVLPVAQVHADAGGNVSRTAKILSSEKFSQDLERLVEEQGYMLLGADRRESSVKEQLKKTWPNFYLVSDSDRAGRRMALQFKTTPAKDYGSVVVQMVAYDYNRNPQLEPRRMIDGRFVQIASGESAEAIRVKLRRAADGIEDSFRRHAAETASNSASGFFASLAEGLVPSAHAGMGSSLLGIGVALLAAGFVAGGIFIMTKKIVVNEIDLAKPLGGFMVLLGVLTCALGFVSFGGDGSVIIESGGGGGGSF